MTKIYLLFATIRPNMFCETYKIWMERLENATAFSSNLKTIVGVNSIDDANITKRVLNEADSVIRVKTNKIGVCYPSYILSSSLKDEKDINDNDIIIFASDDFIPCMNWETYLISKLDGKEGCLNLRDGYQLPDSSNMRDFIISLPIMTYGCLKKLNYIIYNPCYVHMCSDAELYLNVKELGLLIDDRLTDETTFEHYHWVNNKRSPDQNDQKYNMNFAADEALWQKRKLMRVEDRLKIN